MVDLTHSPVVDAALLAARRSEEKYAVRVGELVRLHELTSNPDADAVLTACFENVDGKVGIRGVVAATLVMTCQRCLRPMEVSIEDRFHAIVAQSESEMAQLPEEQDVLIADAHRLDIGWLIEEQLLLSRPLAPMHAKRADCQVAKGETVKECDVAVAPSKDGVTENSDVHRPFAGLREQLKRGA